MKKHYTFVFSNGENYTVSVVHSHYLIGNFIYENAHYTILFEHGWNDEREEDFASIRNHLIVSVRWTNTSDSNSVCSSYETSISSRLDSRIIREIYYVVVVTNHGVDNQPLIFLFAEAKYASINIICKFRFSEYDHTVKEKRKK